MVQAAHLHTLKKKKEIILYVLAEKKWTFIIFLFKCGTIASSNHFDDLIAAYHLKLVL